MSHFAFARHSPWLPCRIYSRHFLLQCFPHINFSSAHAHAGCLKYGVFPFHASLRAYCGHSLTLCFFRWLPRVSHRVSPPRQTDCIASPLDLRLRIDFAFASTPPPICPPNLLLATNAPAIPGGSPLLCRCLSTRDAFPPPIIAPAPPGFSNG